MNKNPVPRGPYPSQKLSDRQRSLIDEGRTLGPAQDGYYDDDGALE